MIMSGDRFKFIIINTNPTHTITSSPTNMIGTSPLIATELDHYLQAPPGKFAQFFPESALFTLIKYVNTILYIINLKWVPAPPPKKNIYIYITTRSWKSQVQCRKKCCRDQTHSRQGCVQGMIALYVGLGGRGPVLSIE